MRSLSLLTLSALSLSALTLLGCDDDSSDGGGSGSALAANCPERCGAKLQEQCE